MSEQGRGFAIPDAQGSPILAVNVGDVQSTEPQDRGLGLPVVLEDGRDVAAERSAVEGGFDALGNHDLKPARVFQQELGGG